jgi:hypothetical protein
MQLSQENTKITLGESETRKIFDAIIFKGSLEVDAKGKFSLPAYLQNLGLKVDAELGGKAGGLIEHPVHNDPKNANLRPSSAPNGS